MGKNYTTWPEAREILGEENFHNLVDLPDLHPDLRLMPEEWGRFEKIPYSAAILDKYKKDVVVYPEISHDVNGNQLTLAWFEENFPQIISTKCAGPQQLLAVMSIVKHTPLLKLKWRVIFKNLRTTNYYPDYPYYVDEEKGLIGVVHYIFAALLHQKKTGEMLWVDNNIPICCADLLLCTPIQSGSLFVLQAWKSGGDGFMIKYFPSSEFATSHSSSAFVVLK